MNDLPVWATFNAIQKCRILKIDKDIIYALLVTGNLKTVNQRLQYYCFDSC